MEKGKIQNTLIEKKKFVSSASIVTYISFR